MNFQERVCVEGEKDADTSTASGLSAQELSGVWFSVGGPARRHFSNVVGVRQCRDYRLQRWAHDIGKLGT
jgi:hypothetical protein